MERVCPGRGELGVWAGGTCMAQGLRGVCMACLGTSATRGATLTRPQEAPGACFGGGG
jgi:hypothetical protein